MKLTFLARYFAYALVISFSFVQSSFAGRESGGGGGNRYAAEFSSIAESAVLKVGILRDLNVAGLFVDGHRMQNVLTQLRIFAVAKDLVLDGRPVDAINDRKKNTITFSIKAWQVMGERQKLRLVLHELVGLTFPEISDLNYRYSEEIAYNIEGIPLSLKILCNVNAFQKANPEEQFFIGDFMSWVDNEATPVTSDPLTEAQDLRMIVGLRRSTLDIKIVGKREEIFSITMSASNGPSLDVRFPHELKINGKQFHQMRLECSTALTRTP